MEIVKIVNTDDKFYVYLNGEIVSIQTTLTQATKKLAKYVKSQS